MAKRHDGGWADLISSEMLVKIRPDGPGWKTITEIAAETGKNRRTMQDVLARWVASGAAETEIGRNEHGRLTAYYRPKPKRRCGPPSAA